MRSITHIAIAGLIAMAGVTVAVAEEGTAPAPAPHATSATAGAVHGSIVSATADKVVVKVKANDAAKGEDRTFTVNAATEIMVDGAKATAADLKAEQKVKIVADGDVAKKIEAGKSKAH